jgi:predicted transcriptional regulator YheO
MANKKPGKIYTSSIKLSSADKLIIESYKTTMEGLAAYFGDAFEFVLHDLSDYDHSVIKIINGFHSGRKEGAPVTDLALSLLEKIRNNRDGGGPFICYTSKSKYGKPVRSATIIISGVKKKPIGFICLNFYMDSPVSSLLQNFSLVSPSDYVTENFTSDSGELIAGALEKVKSEVEGDDSIPRTQKNKEIITILYHQGVFKLKNAVQEISDALGISKNTVYLHIRTLEEK